MYVSARFRLGLMGLTATLIGTLALAQETRAPPLVSTTDGMLQGINQRGATAYLGVPYAAAPVGDLRWRAPRKLSHRQGLRRADHVGNSCMQEQSADSAADPAADHAANSEDCLYLNIWTPAATPSVRLPVMVFIHGGGFAHASGAPPIINGAHLAARGVIVVTINYRLGRFGFFAHPALTREDPSGPLGNYGLLDQIAALRWIKENATAFGGDPTNLTVFGQSAGGVSICYLMASPLAKGLFERAIIESGVIFTPPMGVPRTIEEAEVAGTAAAKAWGLGAADAAALRKIPAASIQADSPPYSWPMIDGKIVPGELRAAFEAGHIARVPLLLGSNSYEVGFQPLAVMSRGLSQRLSEHWPAVLANYDGYGTHSSSLIEGELATDMMFTVPTRQAARAAARSGLPTYLYVFSYLRPSQVQQVPGPVHLDELFAVFGNMDEVESHPNAGTQRIVEDVQSRWVHFAKTGHPTEDPLQWPALTSGSERLLEFTTTGPVLRTNYARARLDLAETLAQPPSR